MLRFYLSGNEVRSFTHSFNTKFLSSELSIGNIRTVYSI